MMVQKRIRAILDARATSVAAGPPVDVKTSGKGLTTYGVARGMVSLPLSEPGNPIAPISPLVSPLVSEPLVSLPPPETGDPTSPTSPLVSPLVSEPLVSLPPPETGDPTSPLVMPLVSELLGTIVSTVA